MNHDEIFQQRWEFRRREVDGDTSSDDNGSNSRGDPNRNHTLVTDLVLLENDEASDDPRCQRHDEKLDSYNGGQLETVKADEKKVQSSKKKKVVQKKSEGRTVKKNTRKRQVTKNDEASDDPRCQRHDEKLDSCEQLETVKADEKKVKSSKKKKVVQKKSEGQTVKKNTRKRQVIKNEMVMFKDLKVFADSLIHELAVAQGNMFAHMREEMRKLVNLEPTKKNVRRSQKKKMCPNNRTKTGVKPQKNNQVLDLATNEPQKSDRLRLYAMAQSNLAYGSDHQVVFSSLDPLPKPQFQNQRNSIHLSDHIPSGVPMISSSGSKTEFDGLMAAKRFPYRIAEFQPEERSGNRSLKGVGLLPQNSSQTTIQGIGFPIPLIQGTNNGMPNLTYCENSFMDNNGVGSRMTGNIARFLGRSIASSERMIPNSIISQIPHTNLRNEH